ncbi:hypothetical protein FGIG_04097 [Fasciola gigantica]|uniref:Disease resistance R13L4/SHOC-2-like LRR domain-containing protein n=1 Tax=Fasciola gigantica TaxID=46835 RepID=A0A504YQT2_FASGI|nr:hypothetical protein FGIG_04097 [Fasciola gigantica]
MDLCNAARWPDDFNRNEQLQHEIKYEGKRCLFLNDVDIHEFNEAIATRLSTQILVVHGYKGREIPRQLERLNELQMLLLAASKICFVPVAVSKLLNLSLLDLSGNRIEEIPDCWDTLENLKVLDLSKNKIDKVPDSLYSLTQLQSLDLSENRLSELSPSISRLKGLQVFSCSFNIITCLPDKLTCLTNLLVLRLMNNRLCYLPRFFSNLSSLLILQLDCNSFDHFPHQIFQCPSLIEFSITNNSVVGPVPQEFGNLRNMRNLNLAHNSCTGLPQTIGGLKHLEYLDFSGNKLRELEFSVAGLQKLEELSFSACGLMTVPEDIGLLKSLVILNLSTNKLDAFPPTISGFPKLTALLLSNNLFSSLPDWICLLDNLVVLELQGNKLSELPTGISRLSGTIRQIDLSHNLFESFPVSLCQPKSRLTYLCLDFNPLKEIPEEICHLKDLTHFTLAGCNNLTRLPPGMGSCTSLRMLRLNHCALESLPPSFAKLDSLKYLDLSHTNFSTFPLVICYLTRLKVLLYDQNEGRPLVIRDDPPGWFARSRVLYPEVNSFTSVNFQAARSQDNFSMYPTLEEALKIEVEEDSGVPALVGRLSQLTHLSLQANGLFVLPDVFHTMNLRRLNLSHNRIYFLPSRFHKSKSLTHLYLHNNRIKELTEKFQQLKKLRVLTLVDNPLTCPPSEICSERKVSPVFYYLRRQKSFEEALLRTMCQTVLDMIPKEAAPALLNKLGFPTPVLEILEQEYPGGYNFGRRIKIALEAWSGLTFDESPGTNRSIVTSIAPEPSRALDSNIQGQYEESERHSSSGKGSVITGGNGVPEPANLGGAAISNDSRLSQVDMKSVHTRESQSLHSFAYGSSPANVTFLLKEAVAGLEVSPKRLMHLVNLLGLTELQEALAQIASNAELPRF